MKCRICLLGLLILLQACYSVNLKDARIPSATVNTYFEYQFTYTTAGNTNKVSIELYDGELPPELSLTDHGLLSGSVSPENIGVYSFELHASYDNPTAIEVLGAAAYVGSVAGCVSGSSVDCEAWDNQNDTNPYEWYTLVVTEQSSNEYCPPPDDTETLGLYICLGDLSLDDLVENAFSLDVTYFINFDLAGDYDIASVTFSLSYDSSVFNIDLSQLTDTILRESAVAAKASLSVEESGVGKIRFTISSEDSHLKHSGRLLDIPVQVLDPAHTGLHTFEVEIDSISLDDDEIQPPQLFPMDGSITL